MQSWQKVFREGFEPLVSTEGLIALETALQVDDDRLVQGVTTVPPPLSTTGEWPVNACCLIGFAGWQGDGLETVNEVEEYFARMCFEIDQRLGEPSGNRFLLNWFDETPRNQMRAELLAEVKRAPAKRRDGAA